MALTLGIQDTRNDFQARRVDAMPAQGNALENGQQDPQKPRRGGPKKLLGPTRWAYRCDRESDTQAVGLG